MNATYKLFLTDGAVETDCPRESVSDARLGAFAKVTTDMGKVFWYIGVKDLKLDSYFSTDRAYWMELDKVPEKILLLDLVT